MKHYTVTLEAVDLFKVRVLATSREEAEALAYDEWLEKKFICNLEARIVTVKEE